MAETEQEIIKQIDRKIEEMKPIFDRMDEDEKLYFLEAYKMMTLDGRKEMEDVANITLNDPLTYATKAIAILGSYQRQTEVKGLTDKKTTKIEEFLADADYMVDEALTKRDIISLDAFIDEQICIRGHIGARCRVKIDKDGKFISPVLPIDTRFFPHDNDHNGMIWGAGIFSRFKAQIEREYEKALQERNISLHEGLNEVRDYWDAEENKIFIAKKLVEENPNTWGYPPFVKVICPLGTTLNTDSALKHKGESIYWANRELFAKKNEIASLLETLTLYGLFPGLQYESTQGENAAKPEGYPQGMRKIAAVEKGAGYKALPIMDIKRATIQLYSIVDACLQKGSLTPLDYGTLTFPLSGVTVHSLIGAREDIFLPRLQAIALFRQALSRMIIDQTIKLNQTVYLGQEGKQNKYTPQDLKGDYTINYRFSLVTKEGTAADAALANSMKGTLSDDYIRRRIFKVDDPDGMKAELDSEEAERRDEVLFLFRKGIGLLYAAEKLTGIDKRVKQMEAKTLMQKIRTIMAQRRAMGQPSPIEKTQPEPKPSGELLPLFSKGGGGAKGTPRETNEEAEE